MTEVRRALQERFPELTAQATVTLRRLPHRGSHEIVLARTATKPVRALIVKRPRPGATPERKATLWRRAETEHHVLTEIAPHISARNSSVTCPRVLGFDPGAARLLLERAPGRTLQSILFDLAGGPNRPDVASIIRLSAEWLAGLHALTRSADERNVFDWIRAELEFPPTRHILIAYAGPAAYGELHRLAARFLGEYPDARKPVCRIHGFFLPSHVLAHQGGICVIDLETSRVGFPYEDVALFTASHEMAVPWRRFVAQRRMRLEERIALFWDTYGKDEPATTPVPIVRRFARLVGMARFVALCLYARRCEDVLAAAGAFADPASAPPLPEWTPSRAVKLRLLELWWRYRLRVASRQELQALRAV